MVGDYFKWAVAPHTDVHWKANLPGLPASEPKQEGQNGVVVSRVQGCWKSVVRNDGTLQFCARKDDHQGPHTYDFPQCDGTDLGQKNKRCVLPKFHEQQDPPKPNHEFRGLGDATKNFRCWAQKPGELPIVFCDRPLGHSGGHVYQWPQCHQREYYQDPQGRGVRCVLPVNHQQTRFWPHYQEDMYKEHKYPATTTKWTWADDSGSALIGGYQQGIHSFDRDNPEVFAKDLLVALGLPYDSEHFQETPRRLVSFLKEFINPDVNLQEVLKLGFEHAESTAMVVQSGIPFRMLCAHHLAPAFGTASVGYIPNGRVVGLSKLARLVDAAGTKSPATQEQITDTIANTLFEAMHAKGAMVVTKAAHTCMTCRGINVPGTLTTVSAIRGAFLESAAARQEFFSLTS